MDDGHLSVHPQALVAAYLLAALCLLIPLAVVGLGVACTVFGVMALR